MPQGFRFPPLQPKGQNTALAGGILPYPAAVYAGKSLRKALHQRRFPFTDLSPMPADKPQALPQAGNADDIEGSALQAVRQQLRLSGFQRKTTGSALHHAVRLNIFTAQ
jgi:hypothetical protein